jgi:hypothetical protein
LFLFSQVKSILAIVERKTYTRDEKQFRDYEV